MAIIAGAAAPASTASAPVPAADATTQRLASIAERLQALQGELQDATRTRNAHSIQELMAERNTLVCEQQQLALHPPAPSGEVESELSDEFREDVVSGSLAHHFSARIAGFGDRPRVSRVSVEELMDRGMSAQEANAEVVAQHRNEILLRTFAHWVQCFGALAVALTLGILGLLAWHAIEYYRYIAQDHIQCQGSLHNLTQIVLALSSMDMVMATCGLLGHEGRTSRNHKKSCCLMMLVLLSVGANVMSLSSLIVTKTSEVPEVPLPSCRDIAPRLYYATLVHSVGLIGYSIFLIVNFFGLSTFLGHLMDQGLLSTGEAAPVGALEYNTVPVTQIDAEDSQCPICLEELTVERAVQTKQCHHTFHKTCLKHWLQVNRACPMCRQSLGELA
eukprot:TRINITY_DN29207_c0_g1_i1.p1 TRINITY_DN29207_c0_g1~~TRINITY_DN29207_c0_g1_i1.p1  ORF type:complete len:434 (-),score=66.60 TRINITY_DN29207_c0_g1_i1:132-1301(-)